MSTVVRFPQRRSAEDRLGDVFSAYRSAVPSKLDVTLCPTGNGCTGSEKKDLIVIRGGYKPFSLFCSFRSFFRDRLGMAEMETIMAEIRATGSFSNHICDKADGFLRTGRPVFKREAQFPPEIIRRPEKNLYFATTFNMIVTKLFVECHRRAFEGKGDNVVYVVPQAQDLDRCSLRLLQNMLLYIKSEPMRIRVVLRQRKSTTATISEPAERRFVASRTRCLRKLFHVAVATGCASQKLDVDHMLAETDFLSTFQRMTETEMRRARADIDEFRDMIYRGAYERFYVAANLPAAAESLSEHDRVVLAKLGLLCDSYNYLFDDALVRIENTIPTVTGSDLCYFLLMKGLIQLKKMNAADAALETLERAMNAARQIADPLDRAVECAFVENAMNFVKLIHIMSSVKVDERQARIADILENEHGILQSVCDAFISVPSARLSDREQFLDTLFILTTVVENIGKLNALCGRREETVQLYAAYEYIFETVMGRMKEEEYKRSFVISFSHALIHIRVAVAAGYAALNKLQDAYNATRALLEEVDSYDITGDYRGFILNAHALNAARIGRMSESVDCLAEMAAIYLDYNEPYMIKAAINRLAPHLAEHEPEAHAFLTKIGIIDDGFRAHDEATFLVSSAVDLENPLLGGLEQMIFGKRAASELQTYEREDRSLKAAYKSYGHWRQIAGIEK